MSRFPRVPAVLATFCLVTALCAAPAAAQQPVELLRDLPVQPKALALEQQIYLENILDAAEVVETRLVQLAAAPIEVRKNAALTLFPGETVKLDQVRVTERGPGDYSWIGTVPGTTTYAILVVDGNDVTGSIVDGDRLYGIRPLGGGVSAVVRFDEKSLPAEEHPPEAYAAISATIDAQLQGHVHSKRGALGETLEKAACNSVDIIVAYTRSADNAVSNMPSLIQLAVDETNLSYQNSGVGHQIGYIGYYRTNYWDSGNMSTDLNRWRQNGDGYMDEIHGYRNTYDGDVAVLITAPSNYCGIAAAIYASQSTAFAVVASNCATGYYSFGHEIGHLYGARHNTQADPSTSPFSYGHGYYYSSGGWRTVMSYNCPGGCTRLPYWSNPNVTYGGQPMGTSSTNDNVRVLNNTCSTLSGFR